MPAGKLPGAPTVVTRGRKSSRKPAARTSRDSVPRKRSQLVGSKIAAAFQLVNECELEGVAGSMLVASLRVRRAAKFVCSFSCIGTSISRSEERRVGREDGGKRGRQQSRR